MSQHPTEIELESLRGGEGDASLRAHVDACADCQSQLEWLTRLEAELSAPPPTIAVPAGRDQAILELARARSRQLAVEHTEVQRSRSLRRIFAWAGPIAAAAGIALLVTVPFTTRQEPAPAAMAGPGDFDGDGQVDVVDALLLARAVETGQALDAVWDLNGDARVDRADADRIVQSAVSLSGGSL